MRIRIPIISTLYYYYKIFAVYTNYKLIVLLVIILFGGLFEGLGISVVIPLLSFESKVDSDNKYSAIVYGFIEKVGLDVSLKSILFLLVSLFFLKACFMIFQGIYSAKMMTELNKDIKIDFCKKYTNMTYTYFTDNSLGYFNNIITTEIETTISGINNFTRVIICIIYIGIYLFSAFLLNAALTVITLILAGGMFISLKRLSHYIQKLSFLISKTNAEIQNLTIQKLHNFKYLKATGRFMPLLSQIVHKIDENRDYRFQTQVLNALPPALVEILAVVSISGLILYYTEIQNRPMSEIIVLIIFFWRALNTTLNFQGWWQRFNSYSGAIHIVKNAGNKLDQHLEVGGKQQIGPIRHGIELKRVNFSFGAKIILKDIDMMIPKAATIGIVGQSGEGKTTLIDIITGLFEVDSGAVCIDGINYRDIDKRSLRNIIGYVTQEPVIFNDTIANNISLWTNESKQPRSHLMARIQEAAELGYCLSFIDDCEKGYETVIGDKGVKLSVGQRQRIAIAREIFKNPQIILFDEATSALDSDSEHFIQKSIRSLKGKFTMVIIAHRLSTIKDCDIIYVLQNGHIIERGSFDDLNKSSTVFRKMCESQRLT